MAVPPDDRGRGCALPQPTTGGTTSHTYLVPEKSLASTLRAPTTSTFSVMVVAEGTPPTEPLPDDRRRALMTKKGAHRQRGVADELLLARMRSMFYFRETAATTERGECSVKRQPTSTGPRSMATARDKKWEQKRRAYIQRRQQGGSPATAGGDQLPSTSSLLRTSQQSPAAPVPTTLPTAQARVAATSTQAVRSPHRGYVAGGAALWGHTLCLTHVAWNTVGFSVPAQPDMHPTRRGRVQRGNSPGGHGGQPRGAKHHIWDDDDTAAGAGSSQRTPVRGGSGRPSPGPGGGLDDHLSSPRTVARRARTPFALDGTGPRTPNHRITRPATSVSRSSGKSQVRCVHLRAAN